MVLRNAALRPAANGCNVSFPGVSINKTQSPFALPSIVDISNSLAQISVTVSL